MKIKHITGRVNQSTYDKIKEMADADGRSFNNMLNRILEEAVKENKDA